MKAAVLNSIPGQLDIEDIEIGEPGPREVLIRTAAAGLCHSDLHFMEGKYPFPCPAVLGHESAGVVEAVGSMVHYVQPGDHVITCLSAFCGHCSQCTDGHLSLCENKGTELVRQPGEPPRLSRSGGEAVNQYLHLSSFAEQMLIHEQALVKIDRDMPLDKAALIGCGVTTGLGAVFRTARVAPGETVAVIGCGGIGLSAVQGARIAGANKIIAIDMSASKLELAQQMGATHVVDASSDDVVAAVKDLTGGGVHHAFEAVGLVVHHHPAFGFAKHQVDDAAQDDGNRIRYLRAGWLQRAERHFGELPRTVLRTLPDRRLHDGLDSGDRFCGACRIQVLFGQTRFGQTLQVCRGRAHSGFQQHRRTACPR